MPDTHAATETQADDPNPATPQKHRIHRANLHDQPAGKARQDSNG